MEDAILFTPGTLRTLVIPGISSVDALRLIARARKYGQYLGMIEDTLAQRCPFCQIDRERNKIILESEHWRVWPCNPPEKNTRLHFLVVPTRHITHMNEMTAGEVLNLWGQEGILNLLRDMQNFTDSGILIRDGAAKLAGTIDHWHLHVMVPSGAGRVESPISKGDEDDAKDLAKAVVFEKVRQAGGDSSMLTAEERAMVAGRGVPGVD